MEYFVLLLLVGVLAALIINGANRRRELDEARAKYHASLAQLKKDPTNADLKQSTLALGRRYSSLTRDAKGVTLFDEVALSNDINAACAAASRHPVPSTSGAEAVDVRLNRLRSLRQQGLINEAEFEEQRTRILREL